MNCLCPAAGYCATFGKRQSPRMHAICQGTAEGLDAGQCDGYRANWFAQAIASGKIDWGCIHRGAPIGQRLQKIEKKGCSDCTPRGQVVSVFGCAARGSCTLLPWQAGQAEAVCRDCTSREALSPRPLARRRLSGLLHPTFSFNNSLLRFGGRLLMAYRFSWDDARIALAELNEDYSIQRQQLLPLKAGAAREDPRLWIFQNKLHVSYTAVQHRGSDFYTDVAYARLAPRGTAWTVAAEYEPVYADRNYWEKNWGFFEHAGSLYCVYSIKPHRVLKIDGDRAFGVMAASDCTFTGKLGRLAGGAPPVRHGAEYYAFYHGVLGDGTERWYSIDLYTFEAAPPFRPKRYVRLPLLLPNRTDRPAGHVPHCVFPGGAFFDEQRQRWVVSFGYYDKYSELVEFDAADVERCLVPLA